MVSALGLISALVLVLDRIYCWDWDWIDGGRWAPSWFGGGGGAVC